jgi:hypothetical protein
MSLFRAFAGGRLRSATNLVAALFIFTTAVLPLTHHGFDCHRKSLAHCTACTVGSGAKAPHTQPMAADFGLNDAGAVVSTTFAAPGFLSLCQSADRAPPALG